MSAAARTLAGRDFSLGAMGERLDALYRDILADQPKRYIVSSAALAAKDATAGGEAADLLAAITPMIITFNEEDNIDRTLEKLTWARKIVVVDSGSDDRTLDIVGRYPNAVVVRRPFDSFAAQCNFGLQHIDSEWVMSMDADYVLSDALVAELGVLKPGRTMRGYRASFVYKIGGRSLRGSLYPSRTVLYRRAGAYYEDDGHTHHVQVAGQVANLQSPIYHDDRKPLSRWFSAQVRYSTIEADHLLAADRSRLSRLDRIRLFIVPAPFLILGYALIVKRGLLDGWPGWHYAMQRMCAEIMLSIELFERRFKPPGADRKKI
jgi:glycosyltransferase involved in cell wall biosynthesis